MNEVGPVGPPIAAAMGRASHLAKQPSSEAVPQRGSDRVELSNGAQLLGKIAALPEVRQELVNRVRLEIATAGYDSAEKMEAILEKVMDDLAG